MAGRIHDVDLDRVVENSGVFRQDGDAALTLQFVGIHDPVGHDFIGAKRSALAQHGVHQRGLAVVNVGNNS